MTSAPSSWPDLILPTMPPSSPCWPLWKNCSSILPPLFSLMALIQVSQTLPQGLDFGNSVPTLIVSSAAAANRVTPSTDAAPAILRRSRRFMPEVYFVAQLRPFPRRSLRNFLVQVLHIARDRDPRVF